MTGEDLDSLDIEIMSAGPLLASITINAAKDESPLTYSKLRSKFIETKSWPQYEEIRRITEVNNELKSRPADIKNWENDRTLFGSLGADSATIQEIHDYLIENADANVTYEELMSAYQAQKDEEKRMMQAANSPEPKIWAESVMYNEVETFKKSLEKSKPVILYFTGYNCINAIKFQRNKLSDTEIYEQLKENFVFVALYVDETKELPLEEQKTIIVNGKQKDLKTIGDYNMTVQMQDFESASQPLLVILNSKKEVLGKANYMTSPSELQTLLIRANKAFNN